MEVVVPSSTQECGTMGLVKLSKGQKRRMRWRKRLRDEREGVVNPESKVEVPQNNPMITDLSNKHCLGRSPDTTAAVAEKSTASKKRKRQKSKKKQPTLGDILEANGERFSGSIASLDVTSVVSKREEYREVANEEVQPVITTTLDTKGTESKREDYVEIADGGIGSSTTSTLDASNTVSKKRKKKKSKKKRPTSVDSLDTSLKQEDTEIAIVKLPDNTLIQGLPTESPVQVQEMDTNIVKTLSEKMNIESVKVLCGTGSGPTSTLDDKSIVYKRKEYMEAANGDKLSVTAAALDANSTESKAEECIEVPDGGRGSSPTATLDPKSAVSKERKKKKSKKKNPALADMLNASVNKEDIEIANVKLPDAQPIEGLPTVSLVPGCQEMDVNTVRTFSEKMSIVKEEILGEAGSDPTATLDAKSIGSNREESMEVANGGTCSTTTSTLDKNSRESKREQFIETVEGRIGSSITTTVDANGKASNKRKKKKSKKKKPTVGDILNASVNEEDTEIANGLLRDTSQIEGVESCQQTDRNSVRRLSEKVMVENVGILKDQNVVVSSLSASADGHGRLLDTALIEEPMQSLVQGCQQKDINVERAPSEKLVTENVTFLKVQNVIVSSLNVSAYNHGVHPERRPTSGEILNTCVNKENSEIANGKLPMQSLVHGCQQVNSRKDGTLSKSVTIGNMEMKDQNVVLSSLEASTVPYGLEPKRTHVAASRKKLIILDVNGLLADIVSPPPKDCIPDFKFKRRSIFKRPFLEEFLRFCFERFDVAIWSSRTQDVLQEVVQYLLGHWSRKLLFLWNMSHCTNSGARTLENRHKCIVFKRLKRIWDKGGPKHLWEKGYYDESNTLLLDDTPYKALTNPKHSGVFPPSYCYKDKNDNLLGPGGDLQVFLEGLAAAENVKTYVEQHPFGQPPIDETDPDWAFYSRLLKGFS